MDLLKLVALDKDDIAVISTHLQDAVLKVGDIVWQPADKRLVLGINRFDWEAAQNGHPEFKRRRTALRFDRVMGVKCRNVERSNPDAVLNLLAVTFDEGECPSGTVTLMFSGGAALRLEVECLEVEFVDLGPMWPTSICPAHGAQAVEQRG
jgi:hypothetical protein